MMALSVGDLFAQRGVLRQTGLVRGQAAINRLGARLPEVAQRYGKSAEQLRNIFENDSDLWLDSNEMLVYADEGMAVAEASFATAGAPTAEAAPFPYTDTFLLNSKPGSSRTIYLDFDGHTTSGSSWNANYTSGADIVSAPFDVDGSPTTFNTTEQDIIQMTWQRMAEDYAPFDVNVTTQYPGEDAINRSTSTDTVYGTRLVVSPTNFTGNSIGGIAYVGVFNYTGGPYYQPAFIMTGGLGSNTTASSLRAKYFAEAGSHEVGHNLGLSHDGKINSDGTTAAYYSGQGDWAPIMGVGYYVNVTQWSKGEYSGATQTQDDLAIIQSYGAALKTDDHSNTVTNATVIGSNAVSASGIISTRTDVDYFTFTVGSGTATLNINPAPTGPNLNISAQILDSTQSVVTTSDPAGLPASISTTLAAGTYYLKIDGVGEGDVLTTGYTDYASLGQYSITGTLVPSGGQGPVAVATSSATSGLAPLTVNFYGSTSYDNDGTIASYSWNFGDGTTSTTANPAKTYSTIGVYPVTLTVVDDQGLVGTANLSITVNANQAPTAIISATPTSGTAPLTVSFSSTGSSDPEGTALTYAWTFGPTGATSTSANPSYTYTTAGTYSARLTVKDAQGLASSTASTTITVNPAPNQAPTAKVAATPTSGSAPLAVAFSSAGSSDPEGSALTYSWNFGNGATSTSANPSYTYTTAGTYTATLTVRDSLGLASAPASVTIVVTGGYSYIYSMAITKSTTTKGTSARVVVTVYGSDGKVRPSASVAGAWSGIVTGNQTATTGKTGQATFTSPVTKLTTGTFTFTVNNITSTGFPYDSTKNIVSNVISIAR